MTTVPRSPMSSSTTPFQAEQAGQRHDERRDADLRDEQPVQDADREARGERDDDRDGRRRTSLPSGSEQQRGDARRATPLT